MENRRRTRRPKTRAYHAYGTCISSEWTLGFEGKPFEGKRIHPLARVELRQAPRPFSVESSPPDVGPRPRVNGYEVFLPGGSIYLNWPGLFEFLISSRGRRITGIPKARVALESFRTYLLGPVLSFALIRQGIEPLHGTIIVKDDAAFALLGDSGYGKSSLAAAFLSAGYRLLTDDLVVLQKNGGHFIAFPGVPRIKLFPRVAHRFLGNAARGRRMHRDFEKRIIPLGPEKVCQSPVPLRAIYVLSEPTKSSNAERITIRRLPRRLAFVAVLKNTFNTRLIDSARLRHQFEMASGLVTQVPMKTLSYPRSLDLLPTVCEAVISDLQIETAQSRLKKDR
jgi:hypothetical protein